MKKLLSSLLAASLILLGTQAFAQASFNAGYLNSTETIKGNSNSINSNGAFAGFTFNVPIAGGFSVAPGLYYSMITNKDAAAGSLFGVNLSGSSTFMEHAVNVPVYLNYGVDVARDMRFFLYGGPTLQYGIASTTTDVIGVGSSASTSKYNNYSNENYNRMNVYLGGGVGFSAAGILVTVGYDYGMMDLYKDENHSAHRSGLKIGVGYAF